MKHIAYIALGSNLAERETYLSRAIHLLKNQQAVNVVDQSSVYETEPVGYTDQNDFLNMVIKVQTSLSPYELLEQCQSIEQELGRERLVKWGPRTIDLDILLYNREKVELDRLKVPHPHMHERAFVMVPLAELDKSIEIPGLNQTASEVLARLPEEDVNSMKVWGTL